MALLFNIIYSMIITVACVIGILASAFMVAVKLLDWAKGRKRSTCDRILLALGISNVCFECTLVVHTYVSTIWIKVYNLNFVYSFLSQLCIWIGYTSCWLSTCLCVFYCVKIVDFNHRLFIWLKLRLSKVVLWMLLGSVVGPLILSIPVHWNVYRDFPHSSINNLTANSEAQGTGLNTRQLYTIAVDFVGFFIPLFLDILSITLILSSLYRHTLQMKRNAAEFCHPRLEAHYRAARMVGSLLLIYIFLCLAQCAILLSPSTLLKSVLWIMIIFCISAQSIILILGNKALKQLLWKILSPLKRNELTLGRTQ